MRALKLVFGVRVALHSVSMRFFTAARPARGRERNSASLFISDRHYVDDVHGDIVKDGLSITLILSLEAHRYAKKALFPR